ncbi:MAG: WcaF family extracellular polysaccharide biosynthesis acetyltransferase [Tepidisphaerales bacterium]
MATPTRNISPYSTGEKIRRVLWGVVQATLFRWSPHPAYRFRAFLLRLFGARLGRNVRVRRTVHIEIPWNLTLGDDVSVGDRAILYCLGPVTIGDRSFVSQYAHLCAGTHDYTSPDYPLQRLPITLGADVWVAADAFVGPGVTVADGVVVGARASVFKDLPPWVVAAGNPAKPIKPRLLAGRSPPLPG